MANVMLSNDQVNRLESENEALKGCPPRIERAVESFEYICNTEHVTEWVQGAPAAQAAVDRLKRNCQNMRECTRIIRNLNEECRHIISWNRMNNNNVNI